MASENANLKMHANPYTKSSVNTSLQPCTEKHKAQHAAGENGKNRDANENHENIAQTQDHDVLCGRGGETKRHVGNNITQPHDHDVLCGRGGETNRHIGNKRYRWLVNYNKPLYVKARKGVKNIIAKSIVEAVRQLSPPGRFLMKNTKTGFWAEVDAEQAVSKTAQTLREGAKSVREQMDMDEAPFDIDEILMDMDEVIMDMDESTDGTSVCSTERTREGMRTSPSVFQDVTETASKDEKISLDEHCSNSLMSVEILWDKALNPHRDAEPTESSVVWDTCERVLLDSFFDNNDHDINIDEW